MLLIAVGAVLLVVVIAVVVESRKSAELQSSPTCDGVDPGGTRFRSPPPPPGGSDQAPAAPAAPTEPGAASPAFRPATARAVYCADFADPFVLGVDTAIGGRLFAYATNTDKMSVPVLSSASVFRSEALDDALAALPRWSQPGAIWAPAVLARDDDALVLYYTTTHRASGRQCISRAVAEDPVGSFVDDSAAPMICPVALGGAIDPSPFVDTDGTAYLLWKNDGNCCGIPTRLWIQPLSADRLSVTGEARALLTADQPWEGGLVEAPAMVLEAGTYYLFYSANAWDRASYAVGYATCRTVMGPCTKPRAEPWLASSLEAQGPGGQEFYRDGDDLHVVFHAWTEGRVGYRAGGFRSLFTAGVEFRAGRPVLVE